MVAKGIYGLSDGKVKQEFFSYIFLKYSNTLLLKPRMVSKDRFNFAMIERDQYIEKYKGELEEMEQNRYFEAIIQKYESDINIKNQDNSGDQ